MLHTLSIAQVLDIWSDLELCREGKHNYGGKVGEFYMYRLMASNPMVERFKGQDCRGSMFEKDVNEAYVSANLALKALLEEFEARRRVRIQVELPSVGWVALKKWEPRDDAFEHRLHLEVTCESDL